MNKAAKITILLFANILLISIIAGAVWSFRSMPAKKKDTKTVEVVSSVTPSPTAVITISPTPVVRSTPEISVSGSKKQYKDKTLGISFSFPTTLTNVSNGLETEIGDGSSEDTCISFNGDKKYAEDAGMYAVSHPFLVCVDDAGTSRSDYPEGGYNWVKNIISRAEGGEVFSSLTGLKKESVFTTTAGLKVYLFKNTPSEGMGSKIAVTAAGDQTFFFQYYKLTPLDITESQFVDTIKSLKTGIQ